MVLGTSTEIPTTNRGIFPEETSYVGVGKIFLGGKEGTSTLRRGGRYTTEPAKEEKGRCIKERENSLWGGESAWFFRRERDGPAKNKCSD